MYVDPILINIGPLIFGAQLVCVVALVLLALFALVCIYKILTEKE